MSHHDIPIFSVIVFRGWCLNLSEVYQREQSSLQQMLIFHSTLVPDSPSPGPPSSQTPSCLSGMYQLLLTLHHVDMYLKPSMAGVYNPAPGGPTSCRVQLKTCPNTPARKFFLVNLKTSINWFRCLIRIGTKLCRIGTGLDTPALWWLFLKNYTYSRIKSEPLLT